jgi:hypothetical protein
VLHRDIHISGFNYPIYGVWGTQSMNLNNLPSD